MSVVLKTLFMLKRGTQSELDANETLIPATGEPVFETDTLRLKIGDGSTIYKNLPYATFTKSNVIDQSSTDDTTVSPKAVKTYVDNIKANLNGAVSNAILRADEAEANSKAYTDKVKADILGEGITETFDTLVEIQDWINGDGVNATELTTALANEANLRSTEDTALWAKINELIEAYPPYVAEQIATSEANMKTYIDTELGVIANGSY